MAKTRYYSQREIARINLNKTAVDKKLYTVFERNSEGRRSLVFYVGNPDGTLTREEYVDGEDGGTTLRQQLESLGDYSREELIEEINSIKNKIDRCEAIAMSIALG